ncbi:YheC/YheD family protein [Paenibacillus protaetiae]|uniref:YheC/YheD family protein n=1 Tax=Paenibacillus protaetiae TaxID=2509456 RepID=A0A4P6EQI6_9BACL|nr:YheC/YheD family protein [Paenibacillus protaetiae]QAY65104.1 YheC/YheD family protein [Paenibacillus protaetiae]
MLPLIIGIFVTAISSQVTSSGLTETVLPEPAFYKGLSETAAKHHIDLYVFSPGELAGEQLYGYRYKNGVWNRQKVPLPDIVFDRCYYTSAAMRMKCLAALKQLRSRKPFRQLSSPLPSKWDVHHLLNAYPDAASILPPTVKFRSAEQLLSSFARCKDGLFLKPASGMQGKGALLIQRSGEKQQISVDGRTRSNRPFSLLFNDTAQWKRWLSGFIGKTPYIVQPYLHLAVPDGRPFDIRVLMQKDEHGRWSVTGMAARIGKSGSITSNLHGGGTAEDASKLLRDSFGEKIGSQLSAQMTNMSEYIAHRLENRYGRFAELGFDYGIADGGKLWLLEVNSKPGRTAFGLLNDELAAAQSIERPLLYARLLNSRRSPSLPTKLFADGRRLMTRSTLPNVKRPSAR